MTTRRNFLSKAAAAGGLLMTGCAAFRKEHPVDEAERVAPADLTLRIGPVVADIAKDHAISTTGYNGSAPGPLIRLREGVPVVVEIVNQTTSPETVHWHGLNVLQDGDAVPAHASVRYKLTPQQAGLHFVHSHSAALADLSRGTYSGQFAPIYVEARDNPGHYDQEIFLTTHEWEPIFKPGEKGGGWEVTYQKHTINGKCLGYGEPVRVKQGQRVLLHLLNASATETVELALPGHHFRVIGMDGSPVPKPQTVDVVQLAAAERIDAVVEMNTPGIWILGTPKDDDRKNGMGIVVEYAGKNGTPVWTAPAKRVFEYSLFGDVRPPETPDAVIPLIFGKINGGLGNFNLWTVNRKSFEEKDAPQVLHRERRQRFVFENLTDEAHPVHLHGNTLELVSVNGFPTGGIRKDVILVKGFGKVEADVVPSVAGQSLFHCHHQLRMDFGFRRLFDVL